jgi:hypothetical protein
VAVQLVTAQEPTVSIKYSPWVLHQLTASAITPQVASHNGVVENQGVGEKLKKLASPYRATAVIFPYRNLAGELYQPNFWRARFLAINPTNLAAPPVSNLKQRYYQPAGSPNHIYFPRGVKEAAISAGYLLITEGEKKALSAMSHNIPCAALAGVDSWRAQWLAIKVTLGPETGQPINLILPTKETPVLRIKPAEEIKEVTKEAVGLKELAEFIIAYDIKLLLAFDSGPFPEPNDKWDNLDRVLTRRSVQTSLHRFATYLITNYNIKPSHIGQLSLPLDAQHSKLGLDDYLKQGFLTDLEAQIDDVLSARVTAETTPYFPRHPNLKVYIDELLSQRQHDRNTQLLVASLVVSDLDATGRRLMGTDGRVHYLPAYSGRLISGGVEGPKEQAVVEEGLRPYLLQKYGVAPADRQITSRVASAITQVPWTNLVHPWHTYTALPTPTSPAIRSQEIAVIRELLEDPDASTATGAGYFASSLHQQTVSEDSFYFLLNETDVLKVTATEVVVTQNGINNVLLTNPPMPGIDTPTLLNRINENLTTYTERGHLPLSWLKVVQNTTVENCAPLDQTSTHVLFSLLRYISPWLLRWRGLQLPLEMYVGEQNSGKTELARLIREIVTGSTETQPLSDDVRDFMAQQANSGRLLVLDNAGQINNDSRRKLSDMLSKLLTDISPTIETRKLYTNDEIHLRRFNNGIILTAIRDPLQRPDLLSRTLMFRFHGVNQKGLISSWASSQMELAGGREGWLAHHLAVIHLIMRLYNADSHAHLRFKSGASKHRLTWFSEALLLTAHVFGEDAVNHIKFINDRLNEVTNSYLVGNDVVLAALKEFAIRLTIKYDLQQNTKSTQFTSADITAWAQDQEDYANNTVLADQRLLGRFLREHQNQVEEIANIRWNGRDKPMAKYFVQPTTQTFLKAVVDRKVIIAAEQAQ